MWKSAIFTASESSADLEQNFAGNVPSDVKFVVDGTKFNSEAPFVKNAVRRINESQDINELTNRLADLSSLLLSSSYYSNVHYQLVPNPLKKTCEVRVYPVVENPAFEIGFNKKRGISLYKCNSLKIDAQFFNLANSFQTWTVGRRYNFDRDQSKIFGSLLWRLGKSTALQFDCNLTDRTLFGKLREESVFTGCTIGTMVSLGKSPFPISAKISLKERQLLNDKYSSATDLMRTQLYGLQIKTMKLWSNTVGTISGKLGFDPERKERFVSLSGKTFSEFELGSLQSVQLTSRFGLMTGQNITPGDRFYYRPGHELVNHFASLRAVFLSRRHTIFNTFKAEPFSYVQGWAASHQGQLRRQLELGVGCYFRSLSLHLYFGLLDISGTKITPSSRFQVTLNSS